MKKKIKIIILSLLLTITVATLFVGCVKQKTLQEKLQAKNYTPVLLLGDSVNQDGTWKIFRSNKKAILELNYDTITIEKFSTFRAAIEFEAKAKADLKNNDHVVIRKGKIVYIGKKSLIEEITKN